MASVRAVKAPIWTISWLLIGVVLVFLVIRIGNDIPNIINGTLPPEGEFDRRYAENPILAYAHIIPGVVYLIAATFQLSARIRARSLGFHRALGRVALPVGILAGVFGIAVGIVMSFGGVVEALATVVFGAWFVVSLMSAFRAIRSGRVAEHRRWMIRAFAVGLAVGTIRIWVGIFQATGLLTFEGAFGLSFWIAFSLHVTAAEIWLRRRPAPYG